MNRIKSGLFIYSLTPPKENISIEKLKTVNSRRISRISPLNCDAISVYDVQEEKTRTDKERTYEYKPALSPLKYGESISSFTDLPQILYLASGKYSIDELHNIFKENPDKSFVLVGSPGIDVTVKTTLSEAYKVSSLYDNQVGGVVIGERHKNGDSEVKRVLRKIRMGADFFISQCIYDLHLYKKFLNDYLKESIKNSIEMRPVILTFSPIGNKTGLDFMQWLGVQIPPQLVNEITDNDDFLNYTNSYLEDIAKKLIDLCIQKRIPFGINFESVIGKRDEVLASIELAKNVSDYLRKNY